MRPIPTLENANIITGNAQQNALGFCLVVGLNEYTIMMQSGTITHPLFSCEWSIKLSSNVLLFDPIPACPA